MQLPRNAGERNQDNPESPRAPDSAGQEHSGERTRALSAETIVPKAAGEPMRNFAVVAIPTASGRVLPRLIAAAYCSILTHMMTIVSILIMTKRITANLPDDLLREAMKVTGKGITETIIEGLRRVRQARAYAKAQALRGAISLQIDLEESRERDRG